MSSKKKARGSRQRGAFLSEHEFVSVMCDLAIVRLSMCQIEAQLKDLEGSLTSAGKLLMKSQNRKKDLSK